MHNAGLACVIVVAAAICSAMSLTFAMLVPVTSCVTMNHRIVPWVAGGTILGLGVLFVFALYGVAGFFAPSKAPLPAVLRNHPQTVVRRLAGAMVLVLAVVIWLTGGPFKSWFTPFLLILIPLLIQLKEHDRYILGRILGTVVAVYMLTLWVASDKMSKVDTNGVSYMINTLVFVAFAVLFPTCLQIFGLRGTSKATAKSNAPLKTVSPVDADLESGQADR